MFAIIGIVIVLGAIAAGYTMEHGNFRVLLQPAELVIIFGAAVGTVVIANPLPILTQIGKGLVGVFSGSKFTKALYLESLKMLYELFALSRKAGTANLEEAMGEKVEAALVGTFLGILLCYGIFGPLASAMGKNTDAESDYLAFLRMAALGFIKDLSPIMAVELARRAIPNEVRPTFQEMEGSCRGGGAVASKAA